MGPNMVDALRGKASFRTSLNGDEPPMRAQTGNDALLTEISAFCREGDEVESGPA